MVLELSCFHKEGGFQSAQMAVLSSRTAQCPCACNLSHLATALEAMQTLTIYRC